MARVRRTEYESNRPPARTVGRDSNLGCSHGAPQVASELRPLGRYPIQFQVPIVKSLPSNLGSRNRRRRSLLMAHANISESSAAKSVIDNQSSQRIDGAVEERPARRGTKVRPLPAALMA